jgi:hypothetical protein
VADLRGARRKRRWGEGVGLEGRKQEEELREREREVGWRP